MYHHGFATLALAESYGQVDETLLWEGGKPVRSIGAALNLAIGCAATSQKKNRWGGWRYSPDASDADTSVTGAMLMGLLACRNAGLDVPDEVVNAAMDYMRRSTGKDGSVAYSGGFGSMGGSMNLTAIAALTGAVTKTKETDQYKAALKRLQEKPGTPRDELPRVFSLLHGAGAFPGGLRRVAEVERRQGARVARHSTR